MREPALLALEQVARALDGLLKEVVFIGGAVAALLQVERPFPAPRPTDDVDALAAASSYPDFERIRDELRRLGFRESIQGHHAHRWIAPGSPAVPFDLVPIGEHLGASGNPWDKAAMQTAVRSEIAPGLTIRHASAPGFLALKFAAYLDRGLDDPQMSTDLEDIFALVASRPDIVHEMLNAPEAIRSFVGSQASALLDDEAFYDLLTGHLANVAYERAGQAIRAAEQRLRALASR